MQNPGLANVPGYPSGSMVSFIVRGWQSYSGGADWEAAKPGIHSYGQSALGSAFLGEGALPNLSAFGIGIGQIPGFTVFVVPEPSSVALGGLGLFAFQFVRRRTNSVSAVKTCVVTASNH